MTQWRIMYGMQPKPGDYWESMGKSYYVLDVEPQGGINTFRVLLEINDLP